MTWTAKHWLSGITLTATPQLISFAHWVETADAYPKAARMLLRLLLEQTLSIGYNVLMSVEIEIRVLDHGYQIVASGTACRAVR